MKRRACLDVHSIGVIFSIILLEEG